MLKIYNSLNKRVETFSPLAAKEVKLYTCGPTVYSRPHLGNYRTYIWEDTLKRYLLSKGYRVRHVMNVTDFDNTIIRAVKKTGVPREKMTSENERFFRQDLDKLRAIPAEKYPHVSMHAKEMASVVKRLLAKKAAYPDESGRVFFDISKFPSYGKLAGKKLSGAKGKVTWEEYKPRKAGDFLIWQPGEKMRGCRCCESESGTAQPPWNIQCAAMSTNALGGQIDIAMGGYDNLFNHHENTRAIAGALSGKEYSKYWMHIRHLIINGKKMSKRKGNVVLLPDMERRGYSPALTRFILLSVHYRRMLDFTWAYAKKMKERYSKLAKGILLLKKADGNGSPRFEKLLARAEKDFLLAMDSDLNAPKAVAAIEKFVFACNRLPLSKKQSLVALALLKKFDTALACLPLD
ncbi:MAG: class I tRNA ligase family protein [Candidatus Micrarchaeia archaeon]